MLINISIPCNLFSIANSRWSHYTMRNKEKRKRRKAFSMTLSSLELEESVSTFKLFLFITYRQMFTCLRCWIDLDRNRVEWLAGWLFSDKQSWKAHRSRPSVHRYGPLPDASKPCSAQHNKEALSLSLFYLGTRILGFVKLSEPNTDSFLQSSCRLSNFNDYIFTHLQLETRNKKQDLSQSN